MRKPRTAAVATALATSMLVTAPARAQQITDEAKIEALTEQVDNLRALVRQLQEQVAHPASAPGSAASSDEVADLKAQMLQMREQLAKVEPVKTIAEAQAAPGPVAPAGGGAAAPVGGGPTQIIADTLKGVTINGTLDTYYEYNANNPIGRVNTLRAYDVSSNNFSINQADLVLESVPDPANGKRFGMRVDLQYGQATETLQGNPANELRPEVYRNIFQAYGTYVFPVGTGLTVDFGKWASSLGMEGNYTKDQLNYSRSWWFDFLPFYHSGLRMKYQVNDLVAANLWITNGTQQTEAFNNYKDQLYGLVLTPNKSLTWTINYYRGQEHPDVTYLTSLPPGSPPLPSQQGTYYQPIPNPPTGLLNILDTYATWQATPKLMLGGEADYVEQRLYKTSPEQEVYGGALYAGYQLTPQVALAARVEYLADREGLFSGVSQNLREGTFTIDWRPADGFLLRGEYRLDSSNKKYFLGSELRRYEATQPTIGFGAVWWFGQKQGSW
jgi:hypothetical protein